MNKYSPVYTHSSYKQYFYKVKLINSFMALENSLSTVKIKEKLRTLSELIPGTEDHISKFGAFLADTLNDTIVPEGFYVGAELALYDLQKGINAFTGKAIQSDLVGQSPMIYELLRMSIPEIANAVCPESFANGVKSMFDTVNESIKKG